MRSHVAVTHAQSDMFTCQCGTRYRDTTELSAHLERHLEGSVPDRRRGRRGCATSKDVSARSLFFKYYDKYACIRECRQTTKHA